MQGIIIKASKLMEKESKISPVVGETTEGHHVYIFKPKLLSSLNPWVGVKTDIGVSGFVRQETLIELNSKYVSRELKNNVYQTPIVGSEIVFSMERSCIFSIIEVIFDKNNIWYKIETKQGSGYIQAGSDIELFRIIQGEKDMNYKSNGVINTFIYSGTKNGIGMVITSVIFLLVLVGIPVLMFQMPVSSFIDIQNFIMIIGFNIAVLISINGYKDFKTGFKIAYGKGNFDDLSQIKKSFLLFKMLCKTSIIAGFISSLTGLIILLVTLDDVTQIGPPLGIMLLSLIYGLSLLLIVFIPTRFRLEKLLES